MPAISGRLKRIERDLNIDDAPQPPESILIVGVTPESGKEIWVITSDGDTWHRKPDETQEAFISRAKAEGTIKGKCRIYFGNQEDEPIKPEPAPAEVTAEASSPAQEQGLTTNAG